MYRFAPVSARAARGLNSTGITSMGAGLVPLPLPITPKASYR